MTKARVVSKAVVKTETVTVVPVKKGWRVKLYYVNLSVLETQTNELKLEPNQLQLIVNHMKDKFNSTDTASRGIHIVESCIESGNLKTVISPDVLFAYYRKRMEQYGVTLK